MGGALGCQSGTGSEAGSASEASTGGLATGSTGGASTGSTGSTEAPTTGQDDPCDDSPQALADCVDGQAWADDLQFIAEVRTPGTGHWQAVQDLCADRLAELGYEVTLQDYGTGTNVIGQRLGVSLPEEIVLVGAHYDHIEDCRGADDNASGLAAALEIARVLAMASPQRTTMIACWDEEERGLIGSEAFVAAAVAGQQKIVASFNFDMIGFTSAAPNSQTVPEGFDLVFTEVAAALAANEFRGDFIAIVASSVAHGDALALAAAADRVGLKQSVIEIPAGAENSELFDDLRRSDHAPFWGAGYPALFLTDTGEFRNNNYHCGAGPDEVADLDLEFGVGVTRATVEASAIALGWP